MLFFGVLLLVIGFVLGFLVYASNLCDEDIVGRNVVRNCSQTDSLKFWGISLLPGIILISSSILIKKKSIRYD